MDFSFEAISAAEHDRLAGAVRAADRVRAPADRRGHPDRADEDTVREAQAAIEAVAETLERTAQRDVDTAACRHWAPAGMGESR